MFRNPKSCSRVLLALSLAVPLAASAETVELECQIATTMAFRHGDQNENSSDSIRQRYTLDTEARTVLQHYSFNATSKRWEESPKFITDVRSINGKLAVFCDNEQTQCAPSREISTDPAHFSTLVTASPVIIDLASGKLSYTVSLTRTHKESGDWLSVQTSGAGTCTRN